MEEVNNLPQAEEAPQATTPETQPPAKEEGLSKAGEKLPPGMVDEPPDPAKLQAEVERLKEVKKKAEEDAAYWRAEKQRQRGLYYAERERAAPAPPPVQVPDIGPEPKASDFDDYDKFTAAIADHRVKKARAEWDAERDRKDAERSFQERKESLRTKLQEGYQLYPDFEDVAFDRSASHITPMVVDILADCDHPADIAYYLAKNRVEGMKIARMRPLEAARAIAKLEDKIVSARNSESNPPPPKPTTKAPPPIKPVGSAEKVSKDPNKMTMKEFEAWRESQGAKRY